MLINERAKIGASASPSKAIPSQVVFLICLGTVFSPRQYREPRATILV